MSDKQMPSTFGGSFAERKAANAGEKKFIAPADEETRASEPSTFASRKAMRDGKSSVEDKAVKGGESKGRKRT